MTTSFTLSSSPEELRKGFFALETPQDVAALLDVRYDRLVWQPVRVRARATVHHVRDPQALGWHSRDPRSPTGSQNASAEAESGSPSGLRAP